MEMAEMWRRMQEGKKEFEGGNGMDEKEDEKKAEMAWMRRRMKRRRKWHG